MADLFNMDATDLIRLRRFYKKAPKAFKKAAAGTLTGFAFGTRSQGIKIIDAQMTVRNPKFIHGSIRVEKAKANVPLSRLEAMVGSVERPRYTGLAEQELGTAGPRNRVFTSAAREGNFSKPTKAWARLKPNAKYPSPSNTKTLSSAKSGRKDFSLAGLSGAKRIVAFLSMLNERAVAQTFIIKKKFGRFKKGLYRFKKGTVKKLQAFDVKSKPKRVKWLSGGQDAFMTKANIQKVWASAIKFQVKKIK